MSVLKYNNNGTWEGLNIDHASTADSALYDANGDQIDTTYVKKTELNDYLPLSAGENNSLRDTLYIDRTVSNSTSGGIRFCQEGVIKGRAMLSNAGNMSYGITDATGSMNVGVTFDATTGGAQIAGSDYVLVNPTGVNTTPKTGRWYFYKSGAVSAESLYNQSATGSANLMIGSDGSLKRATSLRKYKKDIHSVTEEDAVKGYELNPITFKPKSLDEPQYTQYGFIAEEVNDILPYLNTYDSNGAVAGVAYERVCVILLKQNQMLKTRVDALEKEIRELKNV